MINLLIKGDIAAAFAAASTRHIELTSLAARCDKNEVTASARFDAETLDKVRAWFTADAELIPGFGYPAGTLLHFSHSLH